MCRRRFPRQQRSRPKASVVIDENYNTVVFSDALKFPGALRGTLRGSIILDEYDELEILILFACRV